MHRNLRNKPVTKEVNDWSTRLCDVCLSSNRKLSLLDRFQSVFQEITNDIKLKKASKIMVCWECVMLLKKLKKFKENVKKSQTLLSHLAGLEITAKPLSNLMVAEVTTTDSNIPIEQTKPSLTEVEKNTPHIETDSKESIVVEIKEEQNDSFDDFNYSDDVKDEDYFPEDVKDFELSQDIKAEKPESLFVPIKLKDLGKLPKNTELKKQVKNYKRMLSNNYQQYKEKIPILPSEVNVWKKNELNSKYFKRLKHKCDICLSGVNNQLMTVSEHKQKYHNPTNKKYQCDICNMCIDKKCALRAHILKHYFKYRCTLCGYESYYPKHMNSHLKQVHMQIVKCLLCVGTFKNAKYFFKHYKALHSRFECDYCNKVFKEKRTLESHMLKHHRNHRCEACNISFKNHTTYKRHMLYNHTVQPSEATFCVMCNRQFDNIWQYKTHIKCTKAHAAEMGKVKEKKKVPCPECSNVYASKYAMTNHYRMVHLNQSKYQCNLCNKSLLNRTRYVDHLRYQHEGYVKEKDKMCNICGRGFVTNTILKHHMRTHTGERPHACPHCDAKFAQRTALMTHVKFIHLKAKRK